MRTIIHDLDNIDFLCVDSYDNVISDASNSCIGCFGCWINTPLKCIWQDTIRENGKKLLESDELIIISKCVNGSYSSKVKKILERSISFVEPFFTIREKEIHHKVRTSKKLNFSVFFYGNGIDDVVKKTATNFVLANQKNLNTYDPKIYFINDIKEIKI